jgi:predicted RNase H-like HicB family nuclease
MTFTITLARDEDGMVIAKFPGIPGCVSPGRTKGDAVANVRDAIRESLAVRAELGMPLTVSTRLLVLSTKSSPPQ